MSRSHLETLFERCDEHLRLGEGEQAASLLAQTKISQLKRDERRRFANLCRRAGSIRLGLSALAPLIHSDKNGALSNPTPEEIGEYGVLLLKNGSIHEGLATLARMRSSMTPEAHLYSGFGHMMCWEHADAIPHLEAYLSSNPQPYSALVARMNLTLSLIDTDRYEEASHLVEEILSQAREGSHLRLLGNALELRSQIHLHENRLASCRQDLDEAAKVLGGEKTSDQLFVLKWKSILQGIESRATDPIQGFRAEALKRGSWENVREADFYSLQVKFDQAVFEHLVFGTPFRNYRNRIQAKLGRAVDASTPYLHGNPGGGTYDVSTGELTTRDQERVGSPNKMRLLFSAMLKDFYKPASIASLFAEIYPGEHFDVTSSPRRVHQVLIRARRWLAEQDLPTRIDGSGDYRLLFDGAFTFRVPYEAPGESLQAQWNRLAAAMRLVPDFNSEQAAQAISSSRRQGNRVLEWAVNSGNLIRIGTGRATRYRLKSAS